MLMTTLMMTMVHLMIMRTKQVTMVMKLLDDGDVEDNDDDDKLLVHTLDENDDPLILHSICFHQ